MKKSIVIDFFIANLSMFLIYYEHGFMYSRFKEHAEQSSHLFILKSHLKPFPPFRYTYD
ncbi:hypothetical protein [Staphylococcus epidermidis]|nr:hypothetical protein [Staphylococcus epidermidis]